MRKSVCYMAFGFVIATGPASLISAIPASADCSGNGAATVCAQGDVRGGGPTAPVAGPAYPGYCADPWYCDSGWGIDVDLNPRPPVRPPSPPNRPGRPGIGPR